MNLISGSVVNAYWQTSFSSGAEAYAFKPQGWAALASAGQVHGAREVTIEAVATRANFDTFLNSLVTVYILYTQTDWPGHLTNHRTVIVIFSIHKIQVASVY